MTFAEGFAFGVGVPAAEGIPCERVVGGGRLGGRLCFVVVFGFCGVETFECWVVFHERVLVEVICAEREGEEGENALYRVGINHQRGGERRTKWF